MCNVNDDDGENTLMTYRAPMSIIPKVCRSCENSAQIVLRRKDAYCKRCFLSTSVHKFRATLGKSKMIKAGEKVLFVFSGSHSSMALLHLLHNGLNEENNKRLIFNVDLLYIDEGLILQENIERRMDIITQVKDIAQLHNFSVFVTTLSKVFSDQIKVEKSLELNEYEEDKLQKLFESVKTMTGKEDLLYQLRHKLIAKFSENMNYNKVFSEEVGTDLAVKLLAGISLGRGDQMSDEVGFCDTRYSKVPVLRPLKEFTSKEIAFYNIFHDLKPIKTSSLTTMSSTDVSILKTTESFVNGLQEEFPSTVYTIFRTGDKLKTAENATSGKDRNCVLCNRIIRVTISDKCNVPKSLEFSRKLFQLNTINDCKNEEKSICGCSKTQIFQEDSLSNYFCYGCSLIFREMDNQEDFQKFFVDNAVKEENQQRLKEQISEFLIE